MKKERFDITGMTCSACSARVEKAVTKLAGTAEVSVNLLTNSMQLTYDEGKINTSQIIAAVEQAGYGASVKGKKAVDAIKKEDDPLAREAAAMRQRLLWSVIFLLPVMFIAMHRMFFGWLGLPVPELLQALFAGPENAITFSFAQFLLILPIMYLNRKYYLNGFRNLWQGAPNMDSLVGMGSMAAWQQAGLAQGDKIHFTTEGYKLLGDMLFEAIAQCYRTMLSLDVTPSRNPSPRGRDLEVFQMSE